MALLFYHNDTVIPREELYEKMALGYFKGLEDKKNWSIDFQHGRIEKKDIKQSKSFDEKKFPPIGINKPLSIEIVCIYVGDLPKKLVSLSSSKDILVSSAIKNDYTFDEALRSINYIRQKVKDKEYIDINNATKSGTPIVYYSPALDSRVVNVTYELVADSFKEEAFDTISQVLSTAGAVPIFAPASTVLIAGSSLTKIISKFGKALLETKPYLTESERLSFENTIIENSISNVRTIYNPKHTELKEYVPELINNKFRLVSIKDRSKIYEGDAPYMLAVVHGQKRPELENFAPKIASASLIEKFYGTDSKISEAGSIIEDAMTLYNDFKFREKAVKLQESLKKLNDQSREYQDAFELLNAYKANIITKELQLI